MIKRLIYIFLGVLILSSFNPFKHVYYKIYNEKHSGIYIDFRNYNTYVREIYQNKNTLNFQTIRPANNELNNFRIVERDWLLYHKDSDYIIIFTYLPPFRFNSNDIILSTQSNVIDFNYIKKVWVGVKNGNMINYYESSTSSRTSTSPVHEQYSYSLTGNTFKILTRVNFENRFENGIVHIDETFGIQLEFQLIDQPLSLYAEIDNSTFYFKNILFNNDNKKKGVKFVLDSSRTLSPPWWNTVRLKSNRSNY